jgi:hypothetical protein
MRGRSNWRYRVRWSSASLGTRGSQVQILPLRPTFSNLRSLRGLIWGTKLHVAARHDSDSVGTGLMRTSGFLNRRSQVRVLSGPPLLFHIKDFFGGSPARLANRFATSLRQFFHTGAGKHFLFSFARVKLGMGNAVVTQAAHNLPSCGTTFRKHLAKRFS